jgi:hypothetical protein
MVFLYFVLFNNTFEVRRGHKGIWQARLVYVIDYIL